MHSSSGQPVKSLISLFSSNNEYYIYHTVSLLLVLISLKDRAAWWQYQPWMFYNLVARLDPFMFTMHMIEAAETMTKRIIKILVFHQRFHFFKHMHVLYSCRSFLFCLTCHNKCHIANLQPFLSLCLFFFFISLREHFSQIKFKIVTDSSLDK